MPRIDYSQTSIIEDPNTKTLLKFAPREGMKSKLHLIFADPDIQLYKF